LHYLVLAGVASWDDPLEEHGDFLRAFVRDRFVQTNEVQRAWVLLPCFLRAAQLLDVDELDVVELGASAGLNLVWDRYRYEYAAGEWGLEDAPLTLSGEERRPVPAKLLELAPRVRRHVGIDREPIDVKMRTGVLLVKCFVWGDQTERLQRLDAAIEAVRASPPALVQGDIADELPRVLEDRPALVFQTAVFPYVPPETRESVRATLARTEAPVAFVSAGRPRGEEGWGMRIELYPPGEREFVGHADFHGAWLDYSL
jgi:hypothetical protein